VQKAGAGITTVTIVPVTPAVVVFCVAKLVAHPSTLAARANALPYVVLLRVLTSAQAAELVIIFLATAVAAIPVANSEVVQVVTVFIALKLLDPATFWFILDRCSTCFISWVQTIAKCAVLVCFCHVEFVDCATVTTIPIACAVVVCVVAKAIPFEDEVGAATSRTRFRRVQAGALLTISILLFTFGTTAIAAVPVASTIVVAVIAFIVSLPGVNLALSFAVRIGFDVLGVHALAINAMIEFVVLPAAVTSVPITSTDVVGVVTGLVAFPC